MKVIISQFRLRGFHCPKCKNETQVFGHEPVPTHCGFCSTEMPETPPEYDQMVTTTKTIEQYVAGT